MAFPPIAMRPRARGKAAANSEMIGKPARAKTCEARKGILEEGDEIMEDDAGSEALDAGLPAGGQAVEHYEMSRYGTLKHGRRCWA